MIKSLLKNFLKKYGFVRGTINLNDKQGALHKVWGHIFTNHLFGDYVEFGVYKGDSLIKSIDEYYVFKRWLENEKISKEAWRKNIAIESPLNKKIYFHGLDTFSGMPENNEMNFTFKKGVFISDYDEVTNLLKKYSEQCILYKGLFAENANKLESNLKDRSVAIVNIDCDIYQSSIEALKIIKNYLQIGSIILFDDFNCFNADNNKGQRKALKEFNEISHWKIEPFFNYMYAGQSFLIVGKK